MEIDIEHKDWHEDDSWRQKLPTGNPFSVPAGYFDDLSERIISGVHLEEIKQADALGGFTLPGNYFTELSTNIQSRIAIEEAMAAEGESFAVPKNYFNELSSNIQSRIALEEAVGETAESFTVPQGYFDELSSNVQSRIAMEEALAGQTEEFAVPEGYFESLSSNIQSRITIEETVSADSNAYAVPDGYFNQLQQSILSQTAQKPETKVVQMPSRGNVIRKLVSTAAFKYASAACFAIIVGLAVYMKQASLPSAAQNHTFMHEQLQDVSTDVLENYLENQADATQTERTVIADGSQLDDDALRAAIQDYVDAQ
ncbi:hypothetical protein ABDD95_06760 [Mucilaginibacter sp. PAMB04274]|uniref:hypothetical protein n=1 Tax=Mucilaginibacter sp. PAMB04274 TaxID=3138568 RepID=UPI0031F690D8